jgi:hypothetical protein
MSHDSPSEPQVNPAKVAAPLPTPALKAKKADSNPSMMKNVPASRSLFSETNFTKLDDGHAVVVGGKRGLVSFGVLHRSTHAHTADNANP